MYESREKDLVVKYYDLAFGKGSEHEINWYLDRVTKYGDPVLDLACGTGRLALKIAERGISVVGIDQSKGMLDLFRKKLQKQPASIQDLIRIEEQPMHDFKVEERFRVVICCDAFFHNLKVADEIDCLNCVHQHLVPGGRFLFNIPYPMCSFIDYAEASQGRVFTERARFELENGDLLLVEHAQSGNRLDQSITTTNKVTRYDKEGKQVESGESSWQSRYLYRYEAIHLLYRCGFEVESIEGGYRGSPVEEGKPMVFEAVKAA